MSQFLTFNFYKEKGRKILKYIDLLYQPVALRYKGQPQYGTATGGFFSLVGIVLVGYLFIIALKQVLWKQNVIYDEKTNYEYRNPSNFKLPLNNTFMFAIGVSNLFYTLDLSNRTKYFDVSLKFFNKNRTTVTNTSIPLSRCTPYIWNKYGLFRFYLQTRLDYYLCPKQNYILQLQGKATSAIYKYYQITVSRCTSNPDQTCITPNNTFLFNNDFQNYYDFLDTITESDFTYYQQNYFLEVPVQNKRVGATTSTPIVKKVDYYLNFYFVNTIVNAGEKNYQQQYMDDFNAIPFGQNTGVESEIQVSKYQIQTDQSLFSIQQLKQVRTGSFALQPAKSTSYVLQATDNDYVKLRIKKSPTSKKFIRKYDKIDKKFAYFGGLIGFIMVFFLLVKSYNQACFQVEVTKRICYLSKNKPYDSTKLNLFNYAIYFFIYPIFKLIGKQNLMPQSKNLDNFIQSANQHLDITILFRKVLYSQRLGAALLDQNKQQALYMIEPQNIKQSQVNRAKLQFYENFRDKHFIKRNQPNDQISNSKYKPESSRYLDQSGQPHVSDTIIHNNNGQQSNNTEKRQKTKEQQDYQDLENQMQIKIKELEKQCKRGDKMSIKLYNMIDKRIKKKFLAQGYQQEYKLPYGSKLEYK